jgi:membrane protein implicated in regulation of membrane protease activity
MRRVQYVDLTPGGLFRALSWRGLLALVVAATLAVTLLVVAGFVFLLILPVALVAGLVARWMMGRPQRSQQRRPADEVLEGRYEILDVKDEVEVRGSAHRGPRDNPWG